MAPLQLTLFTCLLVFTVHKLKTASYTTDLCLFLIWNYFMSLINICWMEDFSRFTHTNKEKEIKNGLMHHFINHSKSGWNRPSYSFLTGVFSRALQWQMTPAAAKRYLKDTNCVRQQGKGGERAAVSSPNTNVCDGVQRYTCYCSPSTFNLTSHLCAEGNGGGDINHTVWVVGVERVDNQSLLPCSYTWEVMQ